MSRLTLPVIAVAALAAIRQPVQGQSAASAIVPAGTTLRLTIVGSPIPAHPADNDKITLLRADSTFLWVSGLRHARTDSIAYPALIRLEVRQRPYSRPVAFTASALGTAAMAVFSVVTVVPMGRQVKPGQMSGLARDAAGGGFALGAAIGLFISRERWREVTPPLLVAAPGTR